MAQTDLGKVRLTDAELSEKIIQVNGGVKFGKNADGKPGYVVKDAETGADTVIPFNSGGSSGGFPIDGSICFAGIKLNAFQGNTINSYLYDVFEEVELSKINALKMTINILSWTVSMAYNTSEYREVYPVFYGINHSGVKAIYHYNEYFGRGTGKSNLGLKNVEKNINIPTLSQQFTSLLGVGLRFVVYPGGSSTSYYAATAIADQNSLDNAKMEYVIS